MEAKERTKENELLAKQQKEMVTGDYACSKNCRTCPFPGAKCVENPEYHWTHIK